MANKKPNPDQGVMVLRGGDFWPAIVDEIKWRPPPLESLVSWKGHKRIGFDLECKDETLLELGPGCRRDGSRVIGYSYCIEDLSTPYPQWPKFYVPYAHGCPESEKSKIDNVDYDAEGWLKDQIKDFDGEIVGANLAYDYDWGSTIGANFSRVRRFLDVLVADPLLFELEDEYSLDAVGLRRLGKDGGKDETVLREVARKYGGLDPKGQMWRMPGRAAGPYAEVDALNPLLIMRLQEKDIETTGIAETWDMECRLLPLLVRMTRKGVRVNQDRLDEIDKWIEIEEGKALEIVARETGVPIPVGESFNVELVARALRAAGLEGLIGKTPKTKKDSITKDDLMGETDHKVAVALTRARQVSTIRTTFVNGLRRHITNDGRIHCSFNQIRKTDDNTGEASGVKYGRLSASHPNMQNQPGNSRFTGDNEIGPMWRAIYMPEVGEDWASLDLKQQEPKLSFHYGALLEKAGVKGVRGALALCEALAKDPTLDTYEPIVEIAQVPRNKAKVIWLARAYGKGDEGLCNDLGLPTVEGVFSRESWKYVPVDSPEGERAKQRGGRSKVIAGPEGQKIIDTFDTAMSFLKIGAKKASERAGERGYVTLLDGRRCHFHPNDRDNPRPHDWDDKGSGYDWTHKAFNRIIQGTAAWQTKKIMLAVDEAGYGDLLMLQVHDEVDPSVPRDGGKTARAIAEVMRTAVPLLVPTVVDIEIGRSWGESMMVEYVDANGKKAKTQYRWGMTIVDGVPRYRRSILDPIETSTTVYIPSDDLQLPDAPLPGTRRQWATDEREKRGI